MRDVAALRPAEAGTGSNPSRVEVEIPQVRPGCDLLVPTGMSTPHDEVTGVAVEGGTILSQLAAGGLGLAALVVRPEAGAMRIIYRIAPSTVRHYPEAAFRPRRTRYAAAAELAEASGTIAERAGGGPAGIQALAEEAQSRFTYDHPERRFNDGLEAVPHLSCGLTPGSCIDIHTYFVASLRAAGYEAAYVYGYFFPEERGGTTNDMHCWAVTRHRGGVLEWDIAHHVKFGLGIVRPGLNPRPGRRVAIGHSLEHRYATTSGTLDLKLLAEPVWSSGGNTAAVDGLLVRISR